VSDFADGGLTYRMPSLMEVGVLKVRNYYGNTLEHATNQITYHSLDLADFNSDPAYSNFDFAGSFGYLTQLDNLIMSNISNLPDFMFFSQLTSITTDMTITELGQLQTMDGFWSLS
jgi:hypothetical protein